MAGRLAARGVASALARAASSRPVAVWSSDAPATLARGTAAAAAAAWSSRGYSNVINVVRRARARGAESAASEPSWWGSHAHGLARAGTLRSQHRDTPDNNANTPFEFTPENTKLVRRAGRCRGMHRAATLKSAEHAHACRSRGAPSSAGGYGSRCAAAARAVTRAQVEKILKRYPPNYKQVRSARGASHARACAPAAHARARRVPARVSVPG
jgi:hypothetical protein